MRLPYILKNKKGFSLPLAVILVIVVTELVVILMSNVLMIATLAKTYERTTQNFYNCKFGIGRAKWLLDGLLYAEGTLPDGLHSLLDNGVRFSTWTQSFTPPIGDSVQVTIMYQGGSPGSPEPWAEEFTIKAENVIDRPAYKRIIEAVYWQGGIESYVIDDEYRP